MSNPAENQDPQNAGAEPQGEPQGEPKADGGQPGQQGGASAGSGSPQSPQGNGGGGPPTHIPYHVFAETRRELRELKQMLTNGQPAAPKALPQDQDPRPSESDYDSYAEYVRADAAWNGRQAARDEHRRIRESEEVDSRRRDAETQHQNAVGNWIQKTSGEDAAFHDAAQRLPIGEFAAHQLMRMDNPVPIAKHLIANPAEAMKLAYLSPAEQLIALGELRGKLAGVSGSPQRKPSAGAPNLDPVGAGNQGIKGNPYSSDTDVDAYIAATRGSPGS